MEPIDHLLIKLKAPQPRLRLDGCLRLAKVPELSPTAIRVLQDALHDPDPWVANAARHALSTHESGMVDTTPTSRPPFKTIRNIPPPSILGNLGLSHWLFLIAGTGMSLVAIKEGNWGIAIFVLLFFSLCIVLMGLITLDRHGQLIDIWSDIADQTGLVLEPGHVYIIGNSIPPSLNGTYRGRHISIYKEVEHEPGYEGSIPLVYTCTALEVRGVTAQKVAQLVARYESELNRPNKAIMLTDTPLAFTNRRPSSIYLEGRHLVYRQSGVPADVAEYIVILNLLCQVADQAEEIGGYSIIDGPGSVY